MGSLRERLQPTTLTPKPVCTCHVGSNGWGAIIPPPPCEYHDPPVKR